MPTFGPRVSGAAAHAEAVRREKGGANVFGVRVRGAIPDDLKTSNAAKRAVEHGPRVTAGSKFTDEKGHEADAVSLESIQSILAGNKETFDSLFEAELAREEGARADALHIFLAFETGPNGYRREDVISDIQTLLQIKTPASEVEAQRAELHAKIAAERAEREAANRPQTSRITTSGQMAEAARKPAAPVESAPAEPTKAHPKGKKK